MNDSLKIFLLFLLFIFINIFFPQKCRQVSVVNYFVFLNQIVLRCCCYE